MRKYSTFAYDLFKVQWVSITVAAIIKYRQTFFFAELGTQMCVSSTQEHLCVFLIHAKRKLVRHQRDRRKMGTAFDGPT
jgi:hypothetical protein